MIWDVKITKTENLTFSFQILQLCCSHFDKLFFYDNKSFRNLLDNKRIIMVLFSVSQLSLVNTRNFHYIIYPVVNTRSVISANFVILEGVEMFWCKDLKSKVKMRVGHMQIGLKRIFSPSLS